MAVTVGELLYVISADNSQLKRVLAESKTLASNASQSLDELGRKAKTTSDNVASLGDTTRKTAKDFEVLGASGSAAGDKTKSSFNSAAPAVNKAKKEVDSLNTSIGETHKRVGIAGATFRGMFYTMGAFAGIKLFESTITAASDLNEALSLNKQVFKQYSSDMQEYAKGAADSIGLSNAATLQGTSILALFAKNTGSSTQESVKFSKTLTDLASDMASALNTSVPDALTAINASLRGEQIPIRRYGVLLDDLTLKSEAMSQGIYDGIGPLNAQQRTMSAYAQILKQTTDIQGDFARTQDLPANSWRRLTASFTNFQAEFANTMIPLMSNILAGARGIVEFASNNMGLIRTLIQLAGVFAIVKLAQMGMNTVREFAVKQILAETTATSVNTGANEVNATSHMTVTAAIKARTAAAAQLALAESAAATAALPRANAGGFPGFGKNWNAGGFNGFNSDPQSPGASGGNWNAGGFTGFALDDSAPKAPGFWRKQAANSPIYNAKVTGSLKDLGSSFGSLTTSVRGLAPMFTSLASALLPVIAVLGTFVTLGALKDSWDLYTDSGDREANKYQMEYIGKTYNQDDVRGQALGFVANAALNVAGVIPGLNSFVTPEVLNAAEDNAAADEEGRKIEEERARMQALEKKNQDAIQQALKDRLITENEATVLMHGNLRQMDAMAEVLKISQKNFGEIATSAKDIFGQFNLTNELDNGMVEKEISNADGSTTTMMVPRDISHEGFMKKYGPRSEQAGRIIKDQKFLYNIEDNPYLATKPVYGQLRNEDGTPKVDRNNEPVMGEIKKSVVSKEDLALIMDYDPSGGYLNKIVKLLKNEKTRQKGLNMIEDVKELNSTLAGEATNLAARMQDSFASLFDWLGAEGSTMMWETSFNLAETWSQGWIRGIETYLLPENLRGLRDGSNDPYLDQVERGGQLPGATGVPDGPLTNWAWELNDYGKNFQNGNTWSWGSENPQNKPAPVNPVTGDNIDRDQNTTWAEPNGTPSSNKNTPKGKPAGNTVYGNNIYIYDHQTPTTVATGIGAASRWAFARGGDI